MGHSPTRKPSKKTVTEGKTKAKAVTKKETTKKNTATKESLKTKVKETINKKQAATKKNETQNKKQTTKDVKKQTKTKGKIEETKKQTPPKKKTETKPVKAKEPKVKKTEIKKKETETKQKPATKKKQETKKKTETEKKLEKKTKKQQQQQNDELAANTDKAPTPKPEQTRGKKRLRTITTTEPEPTVTKKVKTEEVFHHTHLTTSGHVLTLGEGDTGQLGLGPDTMERTKPGLVTMPEQVVQVSAGGMHTICVTAKGEVYTWGCNDEGALGRNTPDEDDCMEPGKVDIPHKIVQVCAGDSHSGALTSTGIVYVWGTFRDANGSIGLTPDGKKSETPLEINEHLPAACKIASGSDHLAFITNDQQLYTFGSAEQGQLGRVAGCFSNRGGRKGLEFLLTPQKVHVKKRNAKFTNVWTGQYVTYAQTTEGDIYSTGLNNYFQLGFDDMKNRYVFEKAKSFNPKLNWMELSGGQHHTIALDGEGKVYSLGRKEYGRLGLTSNEEEAVEKSEPTLVPTLQDKTCISIASGSCVSLAVTSEGETFAWGMGTSHQLGQTEDDDLWVPTQMAGKQLQDRDGVQVSAGGQHTVILAKDKQ